MEEILFRGKRTDNGEWVFGYLVKSNCGETGDKDKYSLILSGDSGYGFDECWRFSDIHEIIPKTIGQYIGLKDKNDEKIYSGDIVEYTYKSISEDVIKRELFIVTYIQGCFYCVKPNTFSVLTVGNYITPKDNVLKVVGNIHDNLEILKENENISI